MPRCLHCDRLLTGEYMKNLDTLERVCLGCFDALVFVKRGARWVLVRAAA